jgi:hypothetical protein
MHKTDPDKKLKILKSYYGDNKTMNKYLIELRSKYGKSFTGPVGSSDDLPEESLLDIIDVSNPVHVAAAAVYSTAETAAVSAELVSTNAANAAYVVSITAGINEVIAVATRDLAINIAINIRILAIESALSILGIALT